MSAPGRRRVVIVAEGRPTKGGVASFAETIVEDGELNLAFDIVYLNTARTAVRPGGKLVWQNITHAAQDAVHTFSASRRADVVHLQLMGEPGLSLVRGAALCIAARLGGARVIAHNHSATGNAGRPDVAAYGASDRVLLAGLRFAHLVLMVADPGVETMRRLIRHPDARRMDNAVDIARFTVPDRSTNSTAVVTFVGTICRRKGVHDLIAAAELLHRRDLPDWRLQVIGGQAWTSDEEYEAIMRLAESAGLHDCFTGQLDAESVRSRLVAGDVFVLPSYFEGQPVAIIEAQAAGLPVISTAIGAVPYQVRDGIEGRITEPGDVAALADAIESLVVDATLRRRMGAAARERAATVFEMAKLRAHLSEVYSEPLPSRTARRAIRGGRR